MDERTMEEQYSLRVEDLSEGAELAEEELRAIVGAQQSSRPRQASTCCICGGEDCD